MNREGVIKHWALIEAFKNGAELQYKDSQGYWGNASTPTFSEKLEYRIKPKDWAIGELIQIVQDPSSTRKILGEIDLLGDKYWIISSFSDHKTPSGYIKKGDDFQTPVSRIHYEVVQQ